MMLLSIMRDVLQDDGMEGIVAETLKNWGYDEDSISFLRASSNFVFLFKRDGERYVFRLTEAERRSITAIQNELNYLIYLAENDLPVNLPVLNTNGKLIETVDTPFGLLYAVVFPYFTGDIFELEDLENPHFFEWGKALGAVHHASTKYPNTGYRSFKDDLLFIENSVGQDASIRKELTAIKDWVSHQPDSSFGLIHFDFELDNMIWDGKQFNLIDFEDCSLYWYTADIAFALRDLFEEKVDITDEKFQLFRKGYENYMKTGDNLQEELTMSLRFHDLLMYAKLIEAADIDASDLHNPEWVRNLACRLQKKIEDYHQKITMNVIGDTKINR